MMHRVDTPPSPSVVDQFLNKEDLVKKITMQVMEWLVRDNPAFHTLEVRVMSEPSFRVTEQINFPIAPHHILFSKAKIHVKTCQNGWDIWIIATADNWPEVISHRVGSFVINDFREYEDSLVVRNEVRCDTYSGDPGPDVSYEFEPEPCPQVINITLDSKRKLNP